ncbi:hypothetical protein [Geminicoccus harenae]|uniref:hypothetical protein n=1 Tax=Geminicoccus harenae TaxID=2498453 RepID=UPI00168AB8C2|nr:hypothetical protein [Geminicoccus harenae]
MSKIPTSSDRTPAQRALDEVCLRGWSIRLVQGQPELRARLTTLSPALVDRLVEFSSAIALILQGAGR